MILLFIPHSLFIIHDSEPFYTQKALFDSPQTVY